MFTGSHKDQAGSTPPSFPPHYKKNGHVFIHPYDDTKHYPSVIFQQDPNNFHPVPRTDYFGERTVFKWGLYEKGDGFDDDGVEQTMMERGLAAETLNDLYYPSPTPLEQFLTALMKRKEQSIKQSDDIQDACQRLSLTIKVSLVANETDCWRVFRVPASTSLAVLHDQILNPIMGWSRAYHGYLFQDPRDGSAFGPKTFPGYFDMQHASLHCHDYLDDRMVPIAALLRQVDDQCFYVYDLGDNWRHRLQVLAINDIALTSSTTDLPVELLDGYGACPPEDSIGLNNIGIEQYRQFLQAYKINPQDKKVMKIIHEIETKAQNYCNPTTGKSISFKPLYFDMNYHKLLLHWLLNGPLVQKKDVHSDKFIENIDKCNFCYNRLKPLMQCSNCKKVKYCGRNCQKADWKKHKNVCNRCMNNGIGSEVGSKDGEMEI